MKIGKKLAIGYIVIATLITGIVYTYLHEWRQMNRLENEIKQIHELRKNIRAAYAHMLDLTMFGETILEWNDEDPAIYRAKRLELDSILCVFKEYYSGERIDSLRNLMAEKEDLLFNISELAERQMELNEELAERVPAIAYESAKESKKKKKKGFLEIFRKKEDKTQSVTSAQLHSLNRDVIKKQTEHLGRLSATADNLAYRNLNINMQLKGLIEAMDERITTDLGERERQIIKTREESKIYIAGITLFLFLMLLVSYFVIMRDYTGKERIRKKLEESNRKNAELLEMRKKIILTISHDIRGPLNGIYGSAELAMDTRDKKKRNHKLKNITASCKHILQLVNNLLDVYRLNEAKETARRIPFRISDMLNSTTDGIIQQTDAKGLFFEHEFKDTDVVVKGDPDRIEQIIGNLLSNAIKFTSAGHVRLKASYTDGKLIIEVSDTGIGMSEELLRRIYLPFERATDDSNTEGFGLGLTITKGLVNLLDGSINVKSEPGSGTTFTVMLPLPITNDNIDEEDVVFDDSMHFPQNVIVIDDDSFQLEVIKDMLERNRVSCTVCTKVEKLTEELRKRNYDLLLTDIQMPDANGFELLKLLRRSRIGNSRDIPVVAMTARSDSERNTLLEAGFDGCIFKPFSMNELLKYIATVIKRRKLEHKTDFSKILADVTDRRHILESMIRTCEKDMADLRNAMMSNDIESMRSTAHRMFPMWEMLSMESVLSAYRNILKNQGSDIRTITSNTKLIIDHIERLMDDAENEINRTADEEKDTDSRG